MPLRFLSTDLPGAPTLLGATFFVVLAVVGCRGPRPDPAAVLDEAAPAYVGLVLALGELDPGYVDAYYGPPEWKEQAAAAKRPLAEIAAEAEALLIKLAAAAPGEGADELVVRRYRYLGAQLGALHARIRFLEGVRLSFDEESKAFYDAVSPARDEAHFESILAALETGLAAAGYSEGTIGERYEAFRRDFVIPPDRLDAVFQAAIAACRERTAAHLALPPGESFTVEYVTDQPWSAYNWYQGGYLSLIQVNTDLPAHLDRALDLACHEGYPGHHVYNALLEKNLVRDRGWVEFSVYPLFSPQSLIAEGSANYGIEMAFPGEERLAFERDVLFPLAGLDPTRAATYREVVTLADELGDADTEAARRYLDGTISAEQAEEWLTRYAAMSPARAAQRRRFFDRYRSYVLNYHLGQDLVRAWVEREAGKDREARWRVFEKLLSTPQVPSDLR